MGKRTITRWYTGAWVVWFVALIAVVFMLSRAAPSNDSASLSLALAFTVMWVASLVTIVMWIAALVRLARQRAAVSFVAILVLQLVGLGIVGMLAYALAGPEEKTGYVIRPSVT